MTQAVASNGHARITKRELLGDRKREPQRAVPFYTALPQALIDMDRWLLWHWHWDGKKWDKPPATPRDNGASWGDETRWGRFREACEGLVKYKASGLGFAMKDDGGGLLAGDLDDCVDPVTKEILDWTPEQLAQWPEGAMHPREIMAVLGGYWEFSVSGTGLRFFVICPGVDRGLLGNKSGAEFYAERKYLTVTGYRVDPQTGQPLPSGDRGEIGTVDAELLNGIMRTFGPSKAEKAEAAKTKAKSKAKRTSPAVQAIEPTAEMIFDKMMSASNGEQIAKLWAGDTSAHGGDHSKADSALCCHIAFYAGERPELIDETFRGSKLYRPKWDEVHGGDGRTYGAMTIDNALTVVSEFYSWEPPPCVTNVGKKTVVDEEGNEQVVTFPLNIGEIIETTRQQTGDWPRRSGRQLFADESKSIVWLDNPDALFGYLHAAVGRVTWADGASLVRRGEFYSRFSCVATNYEAIEEFPHFPPLPGHYYAHPEVTAGDGKALEGLLSRYCPATPIDRDLILAYFVTLFWGGEYGARPAFVFTSKAGRGVGKTTIPRHAGRLTAGYFDFSNGEDTATIKKRLLTTEASTKRIPLVDNIKTSKFSWAEAESMVTSSHISGHRLFKGERTRPNSLLWSLTVNGPGMSRDFAQRSVIIDLARPTYSPEWEEQANLYIDKHRWAIIADVAKFFQQRAQQLAQCSRWGLWERDVLARLPDPRETQAVIAERQEEVDVDSDEAGEVEDYFAEQLSRYDYDPEQDWVHIPNLIALEWIQAATNQRLSTTAMKRLVNQWANEGMAMKLAENPCRTYGRGLLWRGQKVSANVSYVLADRIRGVSQTGF